MDTPIRMPFFARRRVDNLAVSKGVMSNLGFVFPARSFVVLAGNSVTDGVTTSGSPTVTSATAGFVPSDVGKPISGTGIPASSYIGVVNSATSIGLSSSATSNVPVNATASATVTVTFGNRLGIKACATAATLVYGWCPDGSVAVDFSLPSVVPLPPNDHLYGLNHWPFDVKGEQFIMNITDGSGHVGAANSAPQLQSVKIGDQYGLYTDTTTKMQMVDTSNTTQKVFTIVGIPDGQSQQDYNGLVLVELISTIVQS